MLYSTALSVFTFAIAAMAAPAEIVARQDGAGSCTSAGAAQVCCDDLLKCLVQILGTPCSTNTYCCDTDAPTGGLVNISALNCNHI
ncbi:hypothetical protein G7046_g3457 [Stylonectria norvegica]|nr:hypothetical protein G7046_g3457 [Stylonectria norvegica]